MPAPTVHGFAEKVALVINGADGVGRAVALQLALQGCYVVVSSEKSAAARHAGMLDELKSLGTLASAFEFSDARTLIGEVDNLFGRIDLLVNDIRDEVDSQNRIQTITAAALTLMTGRPKAAIVNIVPDRANVFFPPDLPPAIRQNCVVTSAQSTVLEHELFAVSNYDDVARVVLFFLSAEARALNRQVLYIN